MSIAQPGRDRQERHPHSRGFTLMEMLVAMTLLGILMTALFGGLRLGTRVWETTDRVQKSGGQALSIRTFLEDRFEQAVPVVLLLADGRSEIVFAGERSALRFASTMPESVGFGPFIIELALRPRPGESKASDLTLRWRLLSEDASPVEQGISERVIVSDLAAVTLAYFGTKEGDDGGPEWHANWEEQEGLPDLIRLELGFNEDDQRHWPPLIVSPRVDEWYDTVS